MGLVETGVKLVADGANDYLNTLTKTTDAEQALVGSLRPAIDAVNTLDDKEAQAAKAAASFAEMSAMAAKNAAELGRDSADAAGDAGKLGNLTIDAARGIMQFDSAADTAAKEAGQFGGAASDATKDVDKLGGGAGDAGKGVRGLGDDAEKGGKGLNVLEQAAIGAARKLGELAVEGAQKAAEAVLQFAVDGVHAAGDFESGMQRFASVTGESLADSGQSLDDFKQLFISLGRDLPVSTAEVQQAAIEMAKGGIDPATIAAGGLRDALNLAAAGEVGIAESAEIMSKQLGVWVDRAADATTKSAFLTQAADLLAQAANASTVDVDELALGMANAGGVAKIAGLSFQETVQTMALIAPGFSSASDAGTSLKTMLARLQPTTTAQADAMKSLGLLTAEGTSRFYDANGAFIGMDKAAQLLHDSLSGLSEAQKESALQAIFGQDAIRAAAAIAEAGSKGYDDMGLSMLKAGTASEQAAVKQKGFNVAVENMMGSLEALQITVGSAVLPALTNLFNLLAGGINAITSYADATIKGKTALAAIAGIVKDALLPALAGVTAATIAYAVANSGQLGIALALLVQRIPIVTAEMWANAAATAAAAAPFVVLAAAVGGVVLIWNKLNDTVASATQKLLESRPWWTDSTKAIEDYSTKTGDAAKALEPYAASIKAMREQIQGEIEDLGKRRTAGLVNDEQMAAELAIINQHTVGLQQATTAYNTQEQAILKAQAASMTATAEAEHLSAATGDLGTQVSLTASDIEGLGKKIQDTYQKGQEAVQAYATTQSEFLSGIEQRQADHAAKIQALEQQKQQATTAAQRTGIDEKIAAENAAYAASEQNAAASYARQQAAQQQHLGQMLIDYTVAQASLGNIAKDKAAEITAALEKEYGLQESSVASTFLHMAGYIDQSAKDSGGSIDGLIGHLRDEQQQAADTQRAMDDYAKTYTATQVNNFIDGEQDARSYIRSLESIPTRVETHVVTYHEDVETGRVSGGGVSGTRAGGGPVATDATYLVGEHGPELFTPDRAGTITSNQDIMSALASPAQIRAASNTTTNNWAMTVINVDARGSNISEAQIEHAVYAGIAAADRRVGSDVDARLRTGV